MVAGEPIVQLDLNELRKKYDMTTMLIITNSNEKKITFKEPGKVVKGQIIGEINEEK